jgi:hypothetical protein
MIVVLILIVVIVLSAYAAGYRDGHEVAHIGKWDLVKSVTNELLRYKDLNTKLREENDSYRELIRTLD